MITSSRKMARGLVCLSLAALAVLGSATTSRAMLMVRITPTSPGATHTLTIEATDVFQTFPSPPNYILHSSGGDTNNPVLTSSADTHTFQSFATPGNNPFGRATASPTLTFHLGNGSNSANAIPDTPFSSSLPITLTSLTTYTSVSGTGFLQPTGSTLLQVPEPSSVVLVSLGALWVVGLVRKHHRARGSDLTDAEATPQESNRSVSPQ